MTDYICLDRTQAIISFIPDQPKCNCSETIECWPGIIVVKARDTDETPKRVGQIKWYRKPEFPMKARGLVCYKC
jgi:hypothetical protein